MKCSQKVISSRQVIAIVDSHPYWQTLHQFAPNTGIIQVGGLCLPSAAVGLRDMVEANFSFPNVTRLLIALGSNDIAHARYAHHDLHSYGNTWLPYLREAISKLFPKATLKFLLPFCSSVIPQSSIDILQQEMTKVFQNKEILQSPFYAACDFEDGMHLNPSARNHFTTFIAKLLTDGKMSSTSNQRNNRNRVNTIPLMNMKLNMATVPRISPNSPNIPYLPPNPITTQHRTYAQVAATTNTGTNSPHEILTQLTSLLPKPINVINKYQ